MRLFAIGESSDSAYLYYLNKRFDRTTDGSSHAYCHMPSNYAQQLFLSVESFLRVLETAVFQRNWFLINFIFLQTYCNHVRHCNANNSLILSNIIYLD